MLNGIHDPSKEASRGGPAEHEIEGTERECEWVSECYVCFIMLAPQHSVSVLPLQLHYTGNAQCAEKGECAALGA